MTSLSIDWDFHEVEKFWHFIFILFVLLSLWRSLHSLFEMRVFPALYFCNVFGAECLNRRLFFNSSITTRKFVTVMVLKYNEPFCKTINDLLEFLGTMVDNDSKIHKKISPNIQVSNVLCYKPTHILPFIYLNLIL